MKNNVMALTKSVTLGLVLVYLAMAMAVDKV